MTVVAFGSSLGGFAVPPALGLLLADFGWQTAYRLAAAFIVIVAAPVIYCALAPYAANYPRGVRARETGSRFGWMGSIVATRAFWALSIGMFSLSVGLSGVQHSLAPFAREQGLSIERSALLISFLSVSMIAGKLFWIAVIDRMSEMRYFTLMAGAVIVGLLILQAAAGTVQICVGLFVLGLAGGGTAQFIPMSASRHFGFDRLGRALSLALIPISLSAVGAPLAGFAFDISGSYRISFAMFAGIAIVGLGAFGILSRRGGVPG